MAHNKHQCINSWLCITTRLNFLLKYDMINVYIGLTMIVTSSSTGLSVINNCTAFFILLLSLTTAASAQNSSTQFIDTGLDISYDDNFSPAHVEIEGAKANIFASYKNTLRSGNNLSITYGLRGDIIDEFIEKDNDSISGMVSATLGYRPFSDFGAPTFWLTSLYQYIDFSGDQYDYSHRVQSTLTIRSQMTDRFSSTLIADVVRYDEHYPEQPSTILTNANTNEYRIGLGAELKMGHQFIYGELSGGKGDFIWVNARNNRRLWNDHQFWRVQMGINQRLTHKSSLDLTGRYYEVLSKNGTPGYNRFTVALAYIYRFNL